ncbi:hypothetical protein IQB76_03345 [Leptospira borgpetersenii serovar Hardjo-bovis]|uniref:Uncharacterized protein n=1 Tax=Leptospira borgpetersenii serovar Hardjo-bovis str. Sponselee TaxID=1303729 RepID=M6BC47_LEPBO|nr:hypothetical protein [Leptospira borgpetersenii]AMX58606.1 hypothetical protein LBK6_09750 [Leptospira borgpetersenii serovar Hardjo]AMX61860.1 hypothetical protein LBK9_09770 [Leptospira borgpetersenii serovar Hardjo]AMX65104.1 hypothetical protein LBK30_09810 [Leptospira borgpetersenii serovar Hardjo]AMX68314.1 hypothetical protein LBHA_09645 [Leptospira borgpetersenii serovar Hardjo]AWV70428.1 hypothetical protein B9T54_10560 [Leptospira borgpetersenii serovar Hardjo-bovis]
MEPEKVISIPIRELSHLKILLSGWYHFLKENYDQNQIDQNEFKDALRSNVVYNIDQDQVEVLLAGKETLLQNFRKSLS